MENELRSEVTRGSWKDMKWKVFIQCTGDAEPLMYEKWFRNYPHLQQHISLKRATGKRGDRFVVRGYVPCAPDQQTNRPPYIWD
jgi:hypothetical protein